MKNNLALVLCAVCLVSCMTACKSEESGTKAKNKTEAPAVLEEKQEKEVKKEEITEKPEEKPEEKQQEEKPQEKPKENTAEKQTEPAKEPEKPKPELEGKVIVVDAGHGKNSSNKKEAIAPGSNETKPAFVSGTRGKNQTEEELNLILALKLQAQLEKEGATVHMTRTGHETEKSNIDRAKFANDLKADLSVKIHADGIENSSTHGVSVLVPGNKYVKDGVVSESRKAGECILKAFVASTGAADRGISVRNDMTGFNWSEVPVIIVEVGFMTNPEEDKLMETEEYQNKMVSGMVSGIKEYFNGK